MSKASILTFLLLFLTVAHAKADIVITDEDPGGNVGTYAMWWQRIADSGDKVVVDGECISACTYMLNLIKPENVCLTERALFGIHQARLMDEETGNAALTDRMENLYYPVWFRQWIAANVPNRSLEVVYVKPDVFVKAGFYKMCPPKQSDHPNRDWIDKLVDLW